MRFPTSVSPAGTALLFVWFLAIAGVAWADTPGQRLPGQAGIRLSTAELMQRQASAGPAQPRPERELEYPDRRGLPQNPDALPLAQWPPADSHAPSPAPSPAAHTAGLAFDGATLTDTGAFPPDSMGAVGPTQFVTFVNGRLRTFSKAGTADGMINADPDVFFASVMTPVSPPVVLNFTSDPLVRYDRLSARWVLAIIDVPCTNGTCTATAANRVLIAVSDAASNGTISGSTVWTFFFFQGDPGTNFLDYPSLGIDANALYIGGNMFSSAGSFVGTNGYVVQKTSVLSAGPIVVNAFANLAAGTGAGPFSPRGVDNLDPAASEGYFIGVDNAVFSQLDLRRVTNPGSVSPTLSGNITLTVPTTTFPNPVTHLGNTGGNNGRLDSLDDRLFAATLRNGRLWTAHNFRVSSAGVASTTAAARNASRWYEIQNVAATPSLVQSGTVFDNAATLAAARQYFIPSITVTGQGHAVIGFTAAGTPIGATPAYTSRLAGDTLGSMSGPPGAAATTFGTSTANYNPPSDPGGSGGRRWGDYSFTSVDPLDDMTVWTIQEYNQATNSYAVRVGKLLAPPPATPTCSGSPIPFTGPTGDVVISATSSAGSGFFDPGPNLPAPALPFSHLSASVTNATVNSVTYNTPTQVTLNITSTVAGLQNVTLTNPDGQSVVANGCIDVQASSIVADLGITKTDGVTSVTTGSNLTYTIVASNAGPAAVTGAAVGDMFPPDLTCTWTCSGGGGGSCTASGTGDINDVAVNLPAGGTATYLASCTVALVTANTSLVNQAIVAVPAGFSDPVNANNSATDTDDLVRLANLSISKTDNTATASPGGSVTYQIVVGNAGPNDASAVITDTFPGSLSACTWTCSATAGNCGPGSTGNISDSGNIQAGGSLTYTAGCTIDVAATGTLSNTATVAINDPTQQDPNTANNSATDVDTLVPTADLALSLTDNRGFAQLGDSLDYVINVDNSAGPSTVSATVSDTLPAQLTGGSWVCVASGGATCNNGSGNTLNDNVTLPAGSAVAYVYSATVQGEDGNGQVANSASVAVTGGGSDPVPGNNAASDFDYVVIFRDGFEVTTLATPLAGLDTSASPVEATLLVDRSLLDQLGIVPTAVAEARTAEGAPLFSFELARFGDAVYLRTVLRGADGAAERGAWQSMDTALRIIDFAWQSASAAASDGSLSVDAGSGPQVFDQRSEQRPLARLNVGGDADQVRLVPLPR